MNIYLWKTTFLQGYFVAKAKEDLRDYNFSTLKRKLKLGDVLTSDESFATFEMMIDFYNSDRDSETYLEKPEYRKLLLSTYSQVEERKDKLPL